MLDNEYKISASDLAGIYKDIAEIIRIEATIKLHEQFNGQQMTFPKKLFSKEYIIKQLDNKKGGVNIKGMASKYGYTERRIRQILKESNDVKMI